MKTDKIVAFILTNRRAKKVLTYRTLRKHGYTGDIYLIVDDLDPQLATYKNLYKNVIVFRKKEIAKKYDTVDIVNEDSKLNTIFYARNACFEIAKQLGVRYFIQLDDDYTDFRYKIDRQGNYTDRIPIKNLDKIFDILLRFYKRSNAKSIAIAQGGDFFGGSKNKSASKHKLKRKCMNSFICDTQNPFEFIGRINEDVNTYVSLGAKGVLFLTIPILALQQEQTQKNEGGMSGVYLDQGTYVKSFFTVVTNPSCTTLKSMGRRHKRLHHSINWNNAVPCIISESYKKL